MPESDFLKTYLDLRKEIEDTTDLTEKRTDPVTAITSGNINTAAISWYLNWIGEGT